MISILFFLTLSAFAASDSKDAFDKSFPRDNTFCSYKGSRVELLIRGENKFTEPKKIKPRVIDCICGNDIIVHPRVSVECGESK